VSLAAKLVAGAVEMRDYLRNISGVDLQEYEINRDIKSFSVPFNSYEDGSHVDDKDSLPVKCLNLTLPNLIWHLNFLVLHKPRSSNLFKYPQERSLSFFKHGNSARVHISKQLQPL